MRTFLYNLYKEMYVLLTLYAVLGNVIEKLQVGKGGIKMAGKTDSLIESKK